MLTEDELDELAADMKTNGQLHPIILDKDGTIIDGRQRQAAGNRAGIILQYAKFDDRDPIAFILSENDKRRHLTKGQRAMIAAKVRSLNKNYSTSRETAKQAGVAQGYVNQATVVLQYAEELTDAVVSGATPLNDAYKVAQERKAAIQARETFLEEFRVNAPDLATSVLEERITLQEAVATLRERQEQMRKHREVTTRLFCQAILLFDPQASASEDLGRHLVQAIDPKLSDVDLSPERLDRALEVFTSVINHLKKKQ